MIAIAPTMVQGDFALSSRWVRYEANTMTMTILASSLNWNWKPPTLTQRAAVPASPVPVPIRRVRIRRPRLTRYSGQANERSHL